MPAMQDLRVLVVDDVDLTRSILREILGRDNSVCHIAEAKNGQDALEALSVSKADLVITDVAMEPIDGISLVRAIRNGQSGAAKDVPIIGITAHTTQRVVNELMALNVNAILCKPVSPLALGKTVQQVLNKSGHGREV